MQKNLDFQNSESFAQKLDEADSLKNFREKFYIPQQPSGEDVLYFTGNSLGLQPKTAKSYIEQFRFHFRSFQKAKPESERRFPPRIQLRICNSLSKNLLKPKRKLEFKVLSHLEAASPRQESRLKVTQNDAKITNENNFQ
jgi:hypothetical protein